MCKVLLNFPTVYRNKQIIFLKRLQILKQEWQEKPSWDQANRRQKLGLVWRIRKKISQIIKDYFCLPFFLLIILCIQYSDQDIPGCRFQQNTFNGVQATEYTQSGKCHFLGYIPSLQKNQLVRMRMDAHPLSIYLPSRTKLYAPISTLSLYVLCGTSCPILSSVHVCRKTNDLIFTQTNDVVRLAWLEADCNMLGGGKTGYLK